ncbi:MAG: hypothetical protein IAE93_05425 [Ignavibacteria bacterium]|nr:hypothetical protein [Ignavibacteria bacterium]
MKIIILLLLALATINCGEQRIDNSKSDSNKRITEEDITERIKISGKYKAVTKNPTDSIISKNSFEFSLKYYYNLSLGDRIVEKYEIDSNKIIIRFKDGSNNDYMEEKIVYEILNNNELLDRNTDIKYQKY